MLRHYEIPEDFPAGPRGGGGGPAGGSAAEDFRGRRDLRDALTVTIDGETARDFDDAITLEELPEGGWRLGVHIADVAHYVAEGGALDLEAYRRGTSVYFPDRAVPMLPEHLSNGLCSLRPGVPRLTLSALLDFRRPRQGRAAALRRIGDPQRPPADLRGGRAPARNARSRATSASTARCWACCGKPST